MLQTIRFCGNGLVILGFEQWVAPISNSPVRRIRIGKIKFPQIALQISCISIVNPATSICDQISQQGRGKTVALGVITCHHNRRPYRLAGCCIKYIKSSLIA